MPDVSALAEAAATTAEGGAPEAVTLEKARELALNADAALKKNEIELGLLKTRADSLWALVFPSVSLGAQADYSIPLDGTSLSAGSVQGNPSFSATARLGLNLNAGLPSSMKSIQLAYRQGLLNYESARLQLTLTIAQTFYTLLAQKQNLSVLESARTFADEQLGRTLTAYRSGYRGELEYMQSRLSAETARQKYEKALAAYNKVLSDFQAALGFDESESIELSGTIEAEKITPDAEQLIAAFLHKRPDIAARRNALEKAKTDRTQRTLAAKAPSLSLSASWGARAGDDFKWKTNDSITTGLALSIPLAPWIPRTQENQELASAAAEVQKAQIDVQDTEDKAKRSIRSLCANIITGWDDVQLSRLQLDIARRTYELAGEAYRQGRMGFLDFESTRNRYTESSQQFLTSELEYKLLTLELASALNSSEAELYDFSKNRSEQ